MRWAKYSPALTQEAREKKQFLDKRSKIGLRPDGSQFVKLFGIDMSLQRERVIEREGYRCSMCWGTAEELHHVISRGKGGDDSMNNLKMICTLCHRKQHVRVLSGKINGS